LKKQDNLWKWGCLLILLAVGACNGSEEGQINRQYLQSEKFSGFKAQSLSEIEKNKQGNQSLALKLEAFAECDDGTFTIPTRIDITEVSKRSKKTVSECISEGKAYNLISIGTAPSFDYIIHWVLLDRKTAYRNQQLLAVILKKDKVQDYKIVGQYQENPTRNINSLINVSKNNGHIVLKAEIKRHIFYPIEQSNTMLTEYSINKEGYISKL
jgi:hypothetical protein